MTSETISSLVRLLADTRSPRPLLRPAFWRLSPSNFCQALTTQFWEDWSADEVWPGVWIGNKGAALKVGYEGGLEVCHMLNCAGGRREGFCCSSALRGAGSVKPQLTRLQKLGVNYNELALRDEESEDIFEKLRPAADWIENALQGGGQILVNCYAGTSRSATVVLAFIITHRGLSLKEALVVVKKCRDIRPNDGFLRQLLLYESQLER